MQTTLARRQRHRRSLVAGHRARRRDPPPDPHRHPDHRRPRERPARRGRHDVHGRCVQLLRAGPAGPQGGAHRPRLRAADDRLRPHRQGRARAPRRAQRREVVRFDQIPGEMLDATTAIEDQNFWKNPGFDPFAIVSAGLDTIAGRPRGASTITQQLVRARLLPPEAFDGLDLRAQDPRDHPVDPPDRGVPGRRGQAGDHHRLPQPELLRQPDLRRAGGGQGLLRQGDRRPDPGPVRDPRRDPAVTDEVRPRAQRRGGLPRPGARADRGDGRDHRVPEARAGGPGRTARSSSAATTSSS